MKKLSTRDIVMIGLLTAINFIAIYIKIPYGTGAFVHLGTATLFATAITFGGVYGGLAGGLGPFLFDIFGGFVAFAPFTLVIKGVTGFVVGIIANKGKGGVSKSALACIIGAIITLAGYMVAWSVLLGGIEVAIANIPSSLISSGVGMVIGIPLGLVLKKVGVR